MKKAKKIILCGVFGVFATIISLVLLSFILADGTGLLILVPGNLYMLVKDSNIALLVELCVGFIGGAISSLIGSDKMNRMIKGIVWMVLLLPILFFMCSISLGFATVAIYIIVFTIVYVLAINLIE